MNIDPPTTVFMGCTIINGGVLRLWIAGRMVAPDPVHRSQSRWFDLSRAQ